jgi:hypothetical protein
MFDSHAVANQAALFSLLTTFVLLVLLVVFAVSFSHDTTKLVVEPIERLVGEVEALADDPFSTNFKTEIDANSKQDEFGVLSIALTRLSMLLALGFGEAGRKMIRDNMKRGGNPGVVDVSLAGRRTSGIYFFCDIRNFTAVTETLKGEVMIFVNQIAEFRCFSLSFFFHFIKYHQN